MTKNPAAGGVFCWLRIGPTTHHLQVEGGVASINRKALECSKNNRHASNQGRGGQRQKTTWRLPTDFFGAGMSKSSNDRRVISEAIFMALFMTVFFYLEAYVILLGGLYGVLLYDAYNRTSHGKRIRERLRRNAGENPGE
ncbi:MAG: hypothetical protein ACXIUB_03720 [Wenzhouxiangella sp.]